MRRSRLGLCLGAYVLMACGTEPDPEAGLDQTADQTAEEDIGQTGEAIVRGAPEANFPQVVLLQATGPSGSTRCSGTIVKPRVVLTAAHCIRPDTFSFGLYVYYGTDYATDVAQLPNIPEPGPTSVWARADSWLVHPDYDPNLNYPDLAIVYLDRELPFQPLPILSERVGHEYVGKNATIVGWGGSKALTADISQVEGAGIKRSGKAPIVGSPTAADYHADDPNPGILVPKIRQDLIKLDGKAPHANPCAGDSGGPLLVKHGHDTALAGVGMWTGLFCEDYSIFTRLDDFDHFLSDAFKAAGKKPIVPELECVRPLSDGQYRAYFGYQNQNGISVEIPFSKQHNQFAADHAGDRPSTFVPGAHPWEFGVTFGARDQLSYTLAPKYGPTTTLRANRHSPLCAADDPFAICAAQCDASLAADCPTQPVDFDFCETQCVQSGQFFTGCEAEYNGYLNCVGALSPDASNWACDPDFGAQPVLCQDELIAALTCAGF